MIAASAPAAQAGPGVGTVVRRIAKNLSIAIVAPTALFYTCVVTTNLWIALLVALVWCYAAAAWRLRTRQPTSMLLWLTVVGLTGRTIVAFATGNTVIYFLQPAFADTVIAAAFLISLRTARPAVARLAAEFYPMTSDVAARPGVQALFIRLTILWAAICAAKAGVSLWLLHTLSVTGFITAKTIFSPSSAVLGAAVTIVLAVRVARREGLLPAGPLAGAAMAGAL